MMDEYTLSLCFISQTELLERFLQLPVYVGALV